MFCFLGETGRLGFVLVLDYFSHMFNPCCLRAVAGSVLEVLNISKAQAVVGRRNGQVLYCGPSVLIAVSVHTP